MRTRLLVSLLLLAAPARAGMLREAMAEARMTTAAGRLELEALACREHDERLKKALAALTARSCAAPGAVTQKELNALARPRAENLALSPLPEGIADCAEVYLYLAGNGRDAARVARLSTPPEASLPLPPGKAPAAGTPVILFAQLLPQAKEFSKFACQAPALARIGASLSRPRDGILFLTSDDRTAAGLEGGLGICDRLLFRRLIGVIRHGNPEKIDSAWIKARVEEYTPKPGA